MPAHVLTTTATLYQADKEVQTVKVDAVVKTIIKSILPTQDYGLHELGLSAAQRTQCSHHEIGTSMVSLQKTLLTEHTGTNTFNVNRQQCVKGSSD